MYFHVVIKNKNINSADRCNAYSKTTKQVRKHQFVRILFRFLKVRAIITDRD